MEQTTQEQVLKLELTTQEIQILAQAILEIPTKFGLPLINKIQKQVTEQTEVKDGSGNTKENTIVTS